jgi:hypothetical protein
MVSCLSFTQVSTKGEVFMPNWIVSAHGWGDEAEGKFRRLFTPTEKFNYKVTMVPPGLEFVVFTHQNATMGMGYGWDIWYALTAGQFGGEDGAYARSHKTKGAGSVIPDYLTRGDKSWPTGVFEVCTDGKPQKVMTIDPSDRIHLSEILSAAFKANGVKRVYWGCCTELKTPTWVDHRWSQNMLGKK